MSAEFFVSTALPHSIAEDAPFHVSVFIAPRIEPDQPIDELRRFELFPEWAAALADSLEVTLVDQDGPLEAEPARVADPVLWAALFPPDTPVVANAVPYWEDHDWRTFSAQSVHDIAMGIHMQTIYADPTEPPLPSSHPLLPHIHEIMRGMIVTRAPGDGHERFEQFDESLLTRDLDERLRRGAEARPRDSREWMPNESSGLRRTEAEVSGSGYFMDRVLLELHRARRYYEREESAVPDDKWKGRPDTPSARLTPMQPEFHERLAMAGDSRELLRRLGLVIDLRVPDLQRLANATTLWASVAVRGETRWNRPMPVTTRSLADGSFVTEPRGREWTDGALALGDESLFQVLDLDADGSALKTERYVWELQRLEKIEANDDPVTAASPAMRATGFTIARADDAADTQDQLYREVVAANRLRAAGDIDEARFAAEQPPLATEDVTRGMRVEVWDDTTARWASLHSRVTEVEVDGFGLVAGDDGDTRLLTEGFIQGTNATQTPDAPAAPVHVHEAAFGWDGWSLAAPRPGRRVRNVQHPTETTENGLPRVDEVAEEQDIGLVEAEKKTHPIRFLHEVAPGTLPRLRFGRSYAFRAFAVDLAGNTRPRALAGDRLADPDDAAPLLEDGHVSGTISNRAAARTSRMSSVVAGLKQATVDGYARQADLAATTLTGVLPDIASAFRQSAAWVSLDDVRAILLGRLRELTDGQLDFVVPASRLTRAGIVNMAIAAAVARDDEPFLRQSAQVEPRALAALVASLLSREELHREGIGAVLSALRTVTLPRPYLRWDPVPSPAVVPRRPFTEGESLRVLVVRSGVTQDPLTLALTVTGPVAYAAASNESVPAPPPGAPGGSDASEGKLYWEQSERHLAPAKTSQVQAEQHGAFDPLIDQGTPAGLRAALAQALREDGTFFSLRIADLGAPGGTIEPYGAATPGVMRLVSSPGPQVEARIALADLAVGDAPPAGYYVVHDADELTLPYLPDPLAHGVAVVFPEAGADRSLSFPFGVEGFTADFPGVWPEVEPFRLCLRGGDELTASVSGRAIVVTLPAGDVQTLTLSSSLSADRLSDLGVWRTMPSSATADPDVVGAATDGLIWGLTPGERFRLVHAVPRPLQAPVPTRLFAIRTPSATAATIVGGVDVHGPSTDNITASAQWTDYLDDISRDAPHQSTSNGIAFTTPVLPFERLAGLAVADVDVHVPGWGRLRMHKASHQFSDTKHRMVAYRFRATTRFREYFNGALLAPADFEAEQDPTLRDDGTSVIGPATTVSVPSSAVPAPPVVHSVLPLFRWSEGPEAEQPLAWRHRRQSGVRIYLDRPWFSSGEGELLGVLLAAGGDDSVHPPDTPAPDGSGFPFVSQWGRDPVWQSPSVERRALSGVELDSLLPGTGPLGRIPGRPVSGPRTLPLPATESSGARNVVVLGYQPLFNPERGLWYVDVAVDPGAAFWPFVRLAIARYQPDSIPGAHLSMPVRCDFVQLPPERTVSVNRTDSSRVRVVVTGPVGTRPHVAGNTSTLMRQNRLIVALLQSPDPEVPGDLGWKTEATVELSARGVGDVAGEVTWVGELGAGVLLDLVRPGVGEAHGWRVRIEEWERFPGDPPALADRPTLGDGPIWEQRLVFADEFLL